jgi:hypothetical protein
MERDEQADYEGKADQLEHVADELEEPAGEVEGQIKETRRDWESKKSDSQTPGAMESPRTEDSPEAPVPGVKTPEAPAASEDDEDEEPPRSDESPRADESEEGQ